MGRLVRWMLSKLTSRQILAIGATLFILDFLIPDPIPFVDEILIAVGTLLLARSAVPKDASGI